ncbi:MAG: alpha/beta hydrolase [Bacteroidota bacterium]
MKQESLKFEFEARYFQEGELTIKTKNLFFVLHGHGQQSKYFIKKFNPLFSASSCVIAPEGLSRYYLEGFSGRVGATWMTREERLTDIQNYLSYLNTLYKGLEQNIGEQTKIHILGFSQGAATASRWAANQAMRFDSLILWSGIFPPDMDFKFAATKFAGKPITYVYGVEDPFLNEERLNAMKVLSNKLKVVPKIIKFMGGHEIEPETLNTLSLSLQ